jgi:poly(hydroxyalkanoate) depolymerase family esterase
LSLSKTIKRLSRARSNFVPAPAGNVTDRLSDLPHFGGNPGHLRARFYVPEGLKGPAPLVVVLHGCTQNAAAYDHGSGWSRLADRHGFVLLFPEQQRANNPNLCFNWFEPGDIARGQGETGSIRNMVQRMVMTHPIDSARIFVTGLSAGGAMASVLLATYPDLFAGGAIIAGLPYGCASNVAQAFGCMGGRGHATDKELGDRVRDASRYKGSWPRISVWQGGADQTVVPSNADAIVRQWADVHGLGQEPSVMETVEGHPRRVWRSADGKEVIEQYIVAGMAHGTPLDPGTEAGQSGEAGAHMLDVGLSSTDLIAAFWGIAPAPPARARRASNPAAPAHAAPRKRSSRRSPVQPEPADGVQKVIEDALRAAGLLR